MRALVDSHIFVNQLQPKDLFRAAYLKKYGKEIPPGALNEDVRKYLTYGDCPNYVIEMMLQRYGCQ